ncbi:MAG TPA: TetR/AcrR family transcriptional regulator [Pseudolabrys sp.]|jgi:TetR/AcrR family transcriptional regulator, copper-responsive repressor|nr:TetR/AcrR family transcriptional regulator [Pseudolabrys sp.]
MVQKTSKIESRRRGRPRAYDPDTALARAADVFWRNGYDGTSLDDLVAATGMNRPSLYAAFGDKRDLYLKTLARYRDSARAVTLTLLADDPPLRVFLDRFYKAALDLYLAGEGGARGCYTIGTAATQATVDSKVRAFLAEGVRNSDAFLAEQFSRARERGEIPRSADPAMLAQLATATLHTLAVRARAGLPRRELAALVATAIDVICGPRR